MKVRGIDFRSGSSCWPAISSPTTLPACDAYMLMEVIHDWADEQAARKILGERPQAAPTRRARRCC